jgi:hypothetical protein
VESPLWHAPVSWLPSSVVLLTAATNGQLQSAGPVPEPIESLALALSKTVSIGQGRAALRSVNGEFLQSEKALHLTARIGLADGEPAARLVVVIDQFEEIFTLCDREELRRALISNLLHAARVASGQTLVIVTMRADFYGKCAVYSDLADALSDHHLLVGPMSEEEIRRAIERPAQLAGREFDARLVDLLIQGARDQRGALPLLQHALLELWKNCAGRRLTVDAYRQIGGLVGALQKRTDSIFSDFSERERDIYVVGSSCGSRSPAKAPRTPNAALRWVSCYPLPGTPMRRSRSFTSALTLRCLPPKGSLEIPSPSSRWLMKS